MNTQSDIEVLYEAYLNPLSVEGNAIGRGGVMRTAIEPATGLATSDFFNLALEHAISSAQTGELFALLAVAIDQRAALKTGIADDELAKIRRLVAHVLKRNLRGVELASEALDGAYLVFLPETARAAAETLAQSLRRALSTTDLKAPPSSPGEITASIGVVGWRSGDDPDSIVQRARHCMQAAHENGGDRVVSEDDPHSPDPRPTRAMSAAEQMVDAELSESPFEIVFYVDTEKLLRTDPPSKKKGPWKP